MPDIFEDLKKLQQGGQKQPDIFEDLKLIQPDTQVTPTDALPQIDLRSPMSFPETPAATTFVDPNITASRQPSVFRGLGGAAGEVGLDVLDLVDYNLAKAIPNIKRSSDGDLIITDANFGQTTRNIDPTRNQEMQEEMIKGIYGGLTRGLSANLLDPNADDTEREIRTSEHLAEFAGSLSPFTFAQKLVSGSKFIGQLPTITKALTRGGTLGGLLSGTRQVGEVIRGGDFSLEEAGKEAAIFGAFDLALQGAGQVGRGISFLVKRGQHGQAKKAYDIVRSDLSGSVREEVDELFKLISLGNVKLLTKGKAPIIKEISKVGKQKPDKFNDFLEKEFKKIIREEEGHQVLGNLGDRGISVHNVNQKFWDNTYDKLPDNLKKRFQRFLETTTASRPGDIVGRDKLGNSIIAKSWKDIGRNHQDLPTEIELLEGTERGFVALMDIVTRGVEKLKTVYIKSPTLISKTLLPKVSFKKPPTIKEISKPKPEPVTIGGKVKNFGTESRKVVKGISDFLGVTDKTLTKLGEKGRQAVVSRKAEMEIAGMNMEDYITKSSRKLGKNKQSQSQDMMFYMEKTGNALRSPKDTFNDVAKRLTPEAKLEVDKIRQEFSKLRQQVNTSGYSEDVGFIDNYVSHMYKGSKENLERATNHFLSKNPFSQKRTIETYFEAITKFNLKPKHDNIYDILRAYGQVSERIVQNNRLAQTLSKVKTIVEGSKKEVSVITTERIPGYTEITSGGLFRALGGKGLSKSVYVHRDLVDPIKAVFSDYNPNKVAHMFDQFNAISKQLKLASSLFHHAALTESAIYSGTNPLKFRDGLRLIGDKSMRDDAVRAGLQLGTPSDAQRQVVDKMLNTLSNIKGIGFGFKMLKAGKTMNDKILWDYYHRGLKMYAYNKKVGQQLNKLSEKSDRALTQSQIAEVKQAVARHVNNAFGGQNFDAMLKTKKWQNIAHRFLLAPDWTISNIRIATSTGKGLVGAGKRSLSSRVEGNLARAYWMRAGLTFLAVSDGLNVALSGHHLWENEEGKHWDIDTGSKDESGRREYIRLSKQVREPFKWATSPFKELGVKSSPGIQVIAEQATGRSASGYPAFRKDTWPFEKKSYEIDAIDRLVAFGKHFIPFSLSGNNKLLTFPVSRGRKPEKRKSKNDSRMNSRGTSR